MAYFNCCVHAFRSFLSPLFFPFCSVGVCVYRSFHFFPWFVKRVQFIIGLHLIYIEFQREFIDILHILFSCFVESNKMSHFLNLSLHANVIRSFSFYLSSYMMFHFNNACDVQMQNDGVISTTRFHITMWNVQNVPSSLALSLAFECEISNFMQIKKKVYEKKTPQRWQQQQ